MLKQHLQRQKEGREGSIFPLKFFKLSKNPTCLKVPKKWIKIQPWVWQVGVHLGSFSLRISKWETPCKPTFRITEQTVNLLGKQRLQLRGKSAQNRGRAKTQSAFRNSWHPYFEFSLYKNHQVSLSIASLIYKYNSYFQVIIFIYFYSSCRSTLVFSLQKHAFKMKLK